MEESLEIFFSFLTFLDKNPHHVQEFNQQPVVWLVFLVFNCSLFSQAFTDQTTHLPKLYNEENKERNFFPKGFWPAWTVAETPLAHSELQKLITAIRRQGKNLLHLLCNAIGIWQNILKSIHSKNKISLLWNLALA